MLKIVYLFLAMLALAYGAVPEKGKALGHRSYSNASLNLARVYDDELYNDIQLSVEKARAFGGTRKNTRDAYSDYAMKLWLSVMFLDQYQQFSVPQDQSQLQSGKATFERLKMGDFKIITNTGVNVDQAVDDVKSLVDIWYSEQVIGNDTRQELFTSFSSTDFQKTSKGNAAVSNNQEVSFFQLGYATTDIFDNKKGTIIYSFIKLKFVLAPIMHTETTKDCWLWGAFCETKYSIKFVNQTISPEEGLNMAAYLRQIALDQFVVENANFIKSLEHKADGFYVLLPDSLQKVVDKWRESKATRPDKIYDKDPFDGNQLPWSQKK